jgi:hypothetical protein
LKWKNVRRPATLIRSNPSRSLLTLVVLALLSSDCAAINIGLITGQSQESLEEAEAGLDEKSRAHLRQMIQAEQQARQDQL